MNLTATATGASVMLLAPVAEIAFQADSNRWWRDVRGGRARRARRRSQVGCCRSAARTTSRSLGISVGAPNKCRRWTGYRSPRLERFRLQQPALIGEPLPGSGDMFVSHQTGLACAPSLNGSDSTSRICRARPLMSRHPMHGREQFHSEGGFEPLNKACNSVKAPQSVGVVL